MDQPPVLSDRMKRLLDDHKKKELEAQVKHVKIPTQGPVTYGYVRVSTAKQVKEGHSVEAQTSRIQQYCKDKHLPDPIIMADNGISGKDTSNRDKFNEMVRLSKKGDSIISYSLSRLGRNSLQILQFIDDMEKRGVNVIVLDKDIDLTTAQGRLMLNVMISVNQFERDQISERTSDVMQSMKQQGKLKTRGCFGYKAVGNKLVEIPEEMAVLDYITVLLYQHPKIRDADITRMVQAKVNEGVLSMRKDSKHDGKIVYQSTISSIIKRNNLREIVAQNR